MNTLNELENLKLAPKITACFVDLDNTLWEGIIAEKQKPKLYNSRLKVLEALRKKGIQLYIVSKNDQKDVDVAFKELNISKDLFTWMMVNWEPKFVNIEQIIRIAEIRSETAVFIDDNIYEINEVKQKIPTIHILEAENIQLLLTVPAIASKTEQSEVEIKERKNRYQTAIQEQHLKKSFLGSDEEFYKKLKREIQIGLVPADNLDRATRLLVETHRLNFNPGKFAKYDSALDYLHARFNKGDLVYVASTFEGENSLGLTGVIIVVINGNTAVITDGTFSCGIIGRDFEPKIILAIIGKLKKRGIDRLQINFTLTATNVRLNDIIVNLGFILSNKETDLQGDLHILYELDIKDFVTEGKFPWIAVSDQAPVFNYVGHPFVINFFNKYVLPLTNRGDRIVNLGSARGEVIGLLQSDERGRFYRLLENKEISFSKVDMEFYPEEKNIVANAEDLSGVFGDESQDQVWAIELLEHTLRPWAVINEMMRICKVGGYIFITVPSFNFPKHEYPVDLWRIGPKTLESFFSRPHFEIISLETEGDPTLPRRTMILVKKINAGKMNIKFPIGKNDLNRNLAIYK